MFSLSTKALFIIVAVLIGILIPLFVYSYYLDNRLEETKIELNEANANIEKTIEAYEYSLQVQKEISTQEAISIEQKEKVIVKNKTLTKEVQKRGEIKQDENSNFTIVTF